MNSSMSRSLADELESSAPDKEIQVHLILELSLGDAEKDALLDKLATIVGHRDFEEVMPGSGVIVFRTRVDTVRSIATLPHVEWLDLEHRATWEAILDK